MSGAKTGAAAVCAPIGDEALFRLMLQEGARLALEPGDSQLLLVTDAVTLGRLDAADAVLAGVAETVVLPRGGTGSVALPPHDRVFLLLSPNMSLGLFATEPQGGGTSAGEYRGGWTVERAKVLELARNVLGQTRADALAAAGPDNSAVDRISSALMRLSTLYAGAVQAGERDLISGRGELMTVLEILKAISSKRQTHDILFVFVEQVAKVVETKRCSIVRVWDGHCHGQVLASHEDSTVSNRRIALEKYPELRLAVETGKRVIVNDVHADPLMAGLGPALTDAGIDALVVIPIVSRDPQVGTLLLRAARRDRGFTFHEISFFEVVAEAASSALEKAQLLETVQLANARLEHLAVTDALTGLYNRRHFQERMDQEVERALRYGLPLSCLMLDVDNFKQVNDTWGHLTGDAVLRAIASRMQGCARRVDLIARYGGEEFVVIQPQTGSAGAVTQAERMRAGIGDTPIDTMAGPVPVTASIGAAVFDPTRMRTTEDLVGSADEALHKAKRLGKNRVVLADNREGKP